MTASASAISDFCQTLDLTARTVATDLRNEMGLPDAEGFKQVEQILATPRCCSRLILVTESHFWRS